MNTHSCCPVSTMTATVRIHFSGRVHRIVPDRKDSLCPMNLESMYQSQIDWCQAINYILCLYCRTNILDRYFNKDFTLKLPDNKKITEVKWLAVYDLSRQNDFGDIYIPEDFEPPRPQRGGSFSKRSNGVSSSTIEILDSKTIKIPEFYYDGKGKKAYFWVGVGPQPSSKGSKIPDELG